MYCEASGSWWELVLVEPMGGSGRDELAGYMTQTDLVVCLLATLRLLRPARDDVPEVDLAASEAQ